MLCVIAMPWLSNALPSRSSHFSSPSLAAMALSGNFGDPSSNEAGSMRDNLLSSLGGVAPKERPQFYVRRVVLLPSLT